MGSELLPCGCYDGPFSAEDQTLVSVRCYRHFRHIAAVEGHTLLTREAVAWAYQRAATVAVKVKGRGKMATSIKTKRR